MSDQPSCEGSSTDGAGVCDPFANVSGVTETHARTNVTFGPVQHPCVTMATEANGRSWMLRLVLLYLRARFGRAVCSVHCPRGWKSHLLVSWPLDKWLFDRWGGSIRDAGREKVRALWAAEMRRYEQTADYFEMNDQAARFRCENDQTQQLGGGK